jgi:hypothetical protein
VSGYSLPSSEMFYGYHDNSVSGYSLPQSEIVYVMTTMTVQCQYILYHQVR